MTEVKTSIMINKNKKELIQKQGIKLHDLLDTALTIALLSNDEKELEKQQIRKQIEIKEKEIKELNIKLGLLCADDRVRDYREIIVAGVEMVEQGDMELNLDVPVGNFCRDYGLDRVAVLRKVYHDVELVHFGKCVLSDVVPDF